MWWGKFGFCSWEESQKESFSRVKRTFHHRQHFGNTSYVKSRREHLRHSLCLDCHPIASEPLWGKKPPKSVNHQRRPGDKNLSPEANGALCFDRRGDVTTGFVCVAVAPPTLCRQTPNLSEPAASPKTDLYPKQSSGTSREGLVSPGFVLVPWVWGIRLVFAVLLCAGFDVCGSAQARSHTLNNTKRSYTSAEGCRCAAEHCDDFTTALWMSQLLYVGPNQYLHQDSRLPREQNKREARV